MGPYRRIEVIKGVGVWSDTGHGRSECVVPIKFPRPERHLSSDDIGNRSVVQAVVVLVVRYDEQWGSFPVFRVYAVELDLVGITNGGIQSVVSDDRKCPDGFRRMY